MPANAWCLPNRICHRGSVIGAQAFAKMRNLTDDMQAALGKAILEAVEKLPPQARQRMAD